MAERFPSLRGLGGVRPWKPVRLARAFQRRYGDADGALHVEAGCAAAAVAILFRLDPEIDAHARRSGNVRALLEIDPAGLLS